MDSGNQYIDQLLEKFSRGAATPADTDQLLTPAAAAGPGRKNDRLHRTTTGHNQEPDNADDIAYWKERLKGGAERITGMSEEKTAMPVQTRPVHRMQFHPQMGMGMQPLWLQPLA